MLPLFQTIVKLINFNTGNFLENLKTKFEEKKVVIESLKGVPFAQILDEK